MREFINELDILDQIPRDPTYKLHNIILMNRHGTTSRTPTTSRRRREPERYILVTGRVFREGFEAGDFPGFELRKESFIARPEESDIGDVEEEHGDAFETEAESPAYVVWDVGVDEKLLFDYPAAQDLEPVALPEDFEFPGWTREWEEGFDPADF